MSPRTPLFTAAAALLAWSSVAAQPSATPATPPAGAAAPSIDPFLEQRVVEELAADGVILSRLGVTLEVESLGAVVLVSLVDPRTQRTMASTKMAPLPADRDGAVATLTPVVAGLAAQLVGHVPGPDADDDRLARIEANQREQAARLEAERQEQARREEAEATYRAQALRFGSELELTVTSNYASLHRRWFAYQGDTTTEAPVSATAFYQMVERPELAEAYERRNTIKWVTGVGGMALTIGAVVMMLQDESVTPDYSQCANGDYNCEFDARRDARDQESEARQRNYEIGLGLALVGAVGVGVATYLHYRPHPISEGEARQLGAEHNRKLRERLGLPVAARRSSPTSRIAVRLAPYADRGGGGVVLGGTF
jgi:hypothetical protein